MALQAMQALVPEVEDALHPFEPVLELATLKYTERQRELIDRLRQSVCDDDWLIICQLQIAIGGAIDMAWRAGAIVGKDMIQ